MHYLYILDVKYSFFTPDSNTVRDPKNKIKRFEENFIFNFLFFDYQFYKTQINALLHIG